MQDSECRAATRIVAIIRRRRGQPDEGPDYGSATPRDLQDDESRAWKETAYT